jgi:type I restriction enzyme S subunit
LGSICSGIQYGLSNSAEASRTHRLLRITAIQNGSVNWDDVPFTTVSEDEKYLLCANDIVFCPYGGYRWKIISH